MTPWMRRIHKWLGLLIGLQLTLWMASGLLMGLLDHDRVQGQRYRAATVQPPAWPQDVLAPDAVLSATSKAPAELATTWLLGRPVYRLSSGADIRLVDARDGAPLAIDAGVARALALADYTGPGSPGTPQWMDGANLEARAHGGPMWAVAFDDDDDTTLYVSAQDGRVLERRNATWRLFDIAWMLHIMDYTGRQNFNNPLVVMMAVGGLWLALTGVWLLFGSFHVGEFVPARWRRRCALAVFDPAGTRLREFDSHAGDSVYLALGCNGLQLPSNCGGGQSCGLCEIRYRGKAPAPTSADRAHLPEGRLRLGYRLACNLRLDHDMEVEVSGGSGLWDSRTATVESVRAVAPFLREVVLRPDRPADDAFQPGCYVQVHVPAYSMPSSRLRPGEARCGQWHALGLPQTLKSREPMRRSYSLSLPVAEAQGRITLLVRFMAGPGGGRRRYPPGRGSSYMHALAAGDTVTFSGPFGDFAVKPDRREKIFIGGGAGMAPLRAMILSLLSSGATERIHFWYGARSLADAPYVDEMAALARRHDNFSWHLVLSEQADGGDAHGLVHEVAHRSLLRSHPDLAGCSFYVCGPPAMLAATRRCLHELGVADSEIAFDDFKI